MLRRCHRSVARSPPVSRWSLMSVQRDPLASSPLSRGLADCSALSEILAASDPGEGAWPTLIHFALMKSGKETEMLLRCEESPSRALPAQQA
eukprot:3279237-Rhodomonas_salina.3